MRIVFLDRDGVLNEDRRDYVKTLDELRVLPSAVEAVARLTRLGYRIFVISNQAGVGKGLISEETLWRITSLIEQAVREVGGEIERFYYCTHTPEDNCDCRKPKPGLILRVCEELGVTPAEVVFVGDAERDVKAARAAGCKSVLVLTGFVGRDEAAKFDPQPDYTADDLHEAVNWILLQDGKTLA